MKPHEVDLKALSKKLGVKFIESEKVDRNKWKTISEMADRLFLSIEEINDLFLHFGLINSDNHPSVVSIEEKLVYSDFDPILWDVDLILGLILTEE